MTVEGRSLQHLSWSPRFGPSDVYLPFTFGASLPNGGWAVGGWGGFEISEMRCGALFTSIPAFLVGEYTTA